jgi:hypothetical protein
MSKQQTETLQGRGEVHHRGKPIGSVGYELTVTVVVTPEWGIPLVHGRISTDPVTLDHLFYIGTETDPLILHLEDGRRQNFELLNTMGVIRAYGAPYRPEDG